MPCSSSTVHINCEVLHLTEDIKTQCNSSHYFLSASFLVCESFQSHCASDHTSISDVNAGAFHPLSKTKSCCDITGWGVARRATKLILQSGAGKQDFLTVKIQGRWTLSFLKLRHSWQNKWPSNRPFTFQSDKSKEPHSFAAHFSSSELLLGFMEWLASKNQDKWPNRNQERHWFKMVIQRVVRLVIWVRRLRQQLNPCCVLPFTSMTGQNEWTLVMNGKKLNEYR